MNFKNLYFFFLDGLFKVIKNCKLIYYGILKYENNIEADQVTVQKRTSIYYLKYCLPEIRSILHSS